jgi:drug/metabolite transporter (DMT)-like permease
MTTNFAAGIALGLLAAAAFECSYVLQALEARRAQPVNRPQVALVGRLARRPLWALGILLSLAGFGLQVLALRQAPLSAVQPLLALGLVLLLALSRWVLGESVGRRELIGVGGVIAGVCVIIVAAPERGSASGQGGLAVACGALAAVALAPYVRRSTAPAPLIIAAAGGDALAALAINEVARAASAHPLVALAWAALAAAAGLLALTSEATALQRSPASVVAPVVLAGQVAVPVLLAPLVAGDHWRQTPGGGTLLLAGLALVVASAGALARSPAVGTVRRLDEAAR